VVGTWSDSKVWSCFVSWIAFDKSYEVQGPGVKIYSGKLSFKTADKDFTLNDGEGDRSNKRRVNFPNKFSVNPTVVVTLADMDVDGEMDLRVNAVAENTTTQGFDLKVGTWSDTLASMIGATWLAFGPGEKDNLEEKKELPKKKAKMDVDENKKGEEVKKVEQVEKECKICFDNDINMVIIPCGHMCVCKECSKLLTNKNNKCPICKAPIQKIVQTFLA